MQYRFLDHEYAVINPVLIDSSSWISTVDIQPRIYIDIQIYILRYRYTDICTTRPYKYRYVQSIAHDQVQQRYRISLERQPKQVSIHLDEQGEILRPPIVRLPPRHLSYLLPMGIVWRYTPPVSGVLECLNPVTSSTNAHDPQSRRTQHSRAPPNHPIDATQMTVSESGQPEKGVLTDPNGERIDNRSSSEWAGVRITNLVIIVRYADLFQWFIETKNMIVFFSWSGSLRESLIRGCASIATSFLPFLSLFSTSFDVPRGVWQNWGAALVKACYL